MFCLTLIRELSIYVYYQKDIIDYIFIFESDFSYANKLIFSVKRKSYNLESSMIS